MSLSATFALYGVSDRMMSLAAGLGHRQDLYSFECFVDLSGIRGNPLANLKDAAQDGSIPAHAEHLWGRPAPKKNGSLLCARRSARRRETGCSATAIEPIPLSRQADRQRGRVIKHQTPAKADMSSQKATASSHLLDVTLIRP